VKRERERREIKYKGEIKFKNKGREEIMGLFRSEEEV
jgi:hypothetical protein